MYSYPGHHHGYRGGFGGLRDFENHGGIGGSGGFCGVDENFNGPPYYGVPPRYGVLGSFEGRGGPGSYGGFGSGFGTTYGYTGDYCASELAIIVVIRGPLKGDVNKRIYEIVIPDFVNFLPIDISISLNPILSFSSNKRLIAFILRNCRHSPNIGKRESLTSTKTNLGKPV
ncbi:unnamed protein product [Rotaria sp. Silwood1]|nr:unnamed protein product [Rotaria sp. Silwood1]